MEIFSDTLCISHTELVDGIISEANLNAMVRRGKLRRVRRGCYGTPALFAVDSLPLKYRTEVYRRHPDLQEKAESKPFVDSIEPDGRALAYFSDYLLADGRHLPTDKQMEYANGCAILNAFGRVIEASNSHRIRQSKPRLNKTEFWRKAAAALPRLADRYPHGLPESPRRLQRRYEDYLRLGYECMVSAKWQNANAAKVDDDTKESLLVQLIAHHNNIDNAMVARLYNAVAKQQGWKEITASTVGVWRSKYDLVTAGGRLGATNFRNERTMQVKRMRPTAPFLMWTLDGWDVELLYQATTTDKKGHSLTTYSNRLTMVVVLDPCCNYPMGYAVGSHETPELIKAALRDALRHGRQLFGQMLRACQIQSDRYAIKTMAPLYAAAADKVTPARAKNAKAKAVEPYFGYLNKTYCKLMNNWSGYGVTTNPKRQPNSEALNRLRHQFPDEAGVRRQIDGIMQIERQSKEAQLRQLMEHLPADRRLEMSREQFLLHFGADTGRRNAIEGQGLRPTIMGQRRDYDSFDIRFREHAGEHWTVLYDPDDLTDVLAVNEDGTLRFVLTQKHVQPMALADRREGDAEELARVHEFNRSLEGHVRDHLALTRTKTEQLIRDNPATAGILGRLLLCDSDGQHKLPKAMQRLEAASAVDADAEEVPLTPPGAAPADADDYDAPRPDDTDDYSIF